jgi:hypothetical protein
MDDVGSRYATNHAAPAWGGPEAIERPSTVYDDTQNKAWVL